jgi:hypothetical protein
LRRSPECPRAGSPASTIGAAQDRDGQTTLESVDATIHTVTNAITTPAHALIGRARWPNAGLAIMTSPHSGTHHKPRLEMPNISLSRAIAHPDGPASAPMRTHGRKNAATTTKPAQATIRSKVRTVILDPIATSK